MMNYKAEVQENCVLSAEESLIEINFHFTYNLKFCNAFCGVIWKKNGR